MLTGRALQDDEPPKVEVALRNVWGVRDVDNRAILPRKVEPFLWSARRRGNRIRLSGYVPDRATRQTVIGLTKAAMPGLDVTDRMNTARGVPPVDTWLAGLSFALKQLSSMRQGDARFEGLALVDLGRGGRSGGLQERECGDQERPAERHSACECADHGACGQPLYVDGSAGGRAGSCWPAMWRAMTAPGKAWLPRSRRRCPASTWWTAWSRPKAPRRDGPMPRLPC